MASAAPTLGPNCETFYTTIQCTAEDCISYFDGSMKRTDEASYGEIKRIATKQMSGFAETCTKAFNEVTEASIAAKPLGPASIKLSETLGWSQADTLSMNNGTMLEHDPDGYKRCLRTLYAQAAAGIEWGQLMTESKEEIGARDDHTKSNSAQTP